MLRIPVPDPPLVDERVRLRPWRHADAEVLVAGWQDADVARWSAVPADTSVDHAERWIAGWAERRRTGISIDLVVTHVDTAEPVGEVGVSSFDEEQGSAEVGFWLLPGARGCGYATDAVRLVSDWVTRRIGVRLLFARTDAHNGAARQVLERAGYQFRGRSGAGHEIWKYEAQGDRTAS